MVPALALMGSILVLSSVYTIAVELIIGTVQSSCVSGLKSDLLMEKYYSGHYLITCII